MQTCYSKILWVIYLVRFVSYKLNKPFWEIHFVARTYTPAYHMSVHVSARYNILYNFQLNYTIKISVVEELWS